jgi:hypothetical protein
MTQGAHGGQSAPLTTPKATRSSRKAGRAGGAAPASPPAPANGAAGAGTPAGVNPSPNPAATSTPWSSTSTTVAGGVPAGSSAPAAPAAPIGNRYTEAPTGAVPLVDDVAAGRGATTTGGGHSAAGRGARARGPRRARLQLRHVNPWTVLKFSCVLSIALFFVWLIVVGVLFGVLDASGVINKINDTYTTIQSGEAKEPVTASVVFGGAAIIGVVNIVLFIALSTVGSVVYNLCADLVGGIEITLSER